MPFFSQHCPDLASLGVGLRIVGDDRVVLQVDGTAHEQRRPPTDDHPAIAREHAAKLALARPALLAFKRLLA